jgi:hypothetical protein
MKIYAYWNSKDLDCKKIFHFMSPNDEYSVISTLERDNTLKIDRICQLFDTEKRADIMSDIQANELIIFLTHGTKDEILKYRNRPNNSLDDILIDRENAGVLKDKIVLAFCCSSAKELGRLCVSDKVGCWAFVGFENDIVYDNGHAEKSRHIIYESYKKAFKRSLEYAVKTNCSVAEYRDRLMLYLNQEAAEAIMKSDNHTLNNMYTGTIDGLVALGDTAKSVVC